MKRCYLTYSRDLGNFKYDLSELHQKGLYGLRLINKGKSTGVFIQRVLEILKYNKENNLALDLLIDLPGEKALIGNVGEGIKIEKGVTYVLCEEPYDPVKNKIPTLNFLPRLDRNKIVPGDLISIADGEVEMSILSMTEDTITCVAQNSFFLTSNRSFNIKGNKLPAYPVSHQDQVLLDSFKVMEISKDIKILVSFVTKASEVKQVKNSSPNLQVYSKIENILAERELEEVIRISDGVMLGRGDLTSTSKMSEVFLFQKAVIEKCRVLEKELIVATGLFGDLKNSGKPSISDIMDFGFLRSMGVEAFLMAGTNALEFPFETLNLISNFEKM